MPEDFDFLLWLLFHHTHYLVDRARQKELHQYGISPSASGVLYTVVKSGNSLPQAKLIKELNMEPQSVTALLSRMVVQGLIITVKDLERKNQVRVEVTEKGSQVYRMSTNRKSITDIMTAMTQEEKEQLWNILAKVRDRAYDQHYLDKSNMYPPSNFDEI